jgi:hypothetical protein
MRDFEEPGRFVEDNGFCYTCLLARVSKFYIIYEGKKQDRRKGWSTLRMVMSLVYQEFSSCLYSLKSAGHCSIYGGRAKESYCARCMFWKCKRTQTARCSYMLGRWIKAAQAARSWVRERERGELLVLLSSKTAPRAACACGTSPNKWERESFTQNEKMRRGSDWLTDGCTARGPPEKPSQQLLF